MKTYKDIFKLPFKLPFKLHDYGRNVRVLDDNNIFAFQFDFDIKDDKKELLLSVINGKKRLDNPDLSFTHKDGWIISNTNNKLILIRGWGYLTGRGGLHLDPDEAANIQDTLANYIVEQLNNRKKSRKYDKVVFIGSTIDPILKKKRSVNTSFTDIEEYKFTKLPDLHNGYINTFICKGKHRYRETTIENTDGQVTKLWICQCGKTLN